MEYVIVAAEKGICARTAQKGSAAIMKYDSAEKPLTEMWMI